MSNLREAFKKVKTKRKITSKAIYDRTKISQNHVSEYLNNKRDVTSDTLWRMVEALEELSPGSKRDFAKLILGKEEQYQVERGRILLLLNTEEIINSMNQREISLLLLVIGRRLQGRK